MKTTTFHGRVALGERRHDIPAYLTRATTVHDCMTAAASTFPLPQPPMATLLSLIQTATTAQQAAATRARGLAAIRNEKLADLASALASERAYVQTLIDAAPGQAQQIVGLAGMTLVMPKSVSKPLLALALGEPSGIVHATANASLLKQGRGKRVTFYNWRFTPDGGKTWIAAPSTPVARTSFTGLTPLTVYGVEVCITDAVGTTSWSDMATIVVH